MLMVLCLQGDNSMHNLQMCSMLVTSQAFINSWWMNETPKTFQLISVSKQSHNTIIPTTFSDNKNTPTQLQVRKLIGWLLKIYL